MGILSSDIDVPSAAFFLSAPTSPERHILDALLFSGEPNTCGEFEFEASKRYCSEEEGAMAFADELFCGGKVLPLKLPPRLRCGTASPAGSSPSSGFRSPFSWLNLWRSDTDPFVVALENVRNGEKRGRKWESLGRRARSLSPFREAHAGWGEELKSSLLDRSEKQSLDREGLVDGPEEQVTKRLAQARGVEFARRVRMVELKKSGKVDSGKSIVRKEPRSQKIKKLLSKSKPIGKERKEEQQKMENSAVTVRKPNFFGRLRFKSNDRSAQCIEKEKLTEVVKFKMAFLQSRPRLFLCLGYGIKTNS